MTAPFSLPPGRRIRFAALASALLFSFTLDAVAQRPRQAQPKRAPSAPAASTAASAQPEKKQFQPSEKTSEAFTKLKPLQDAQNWDGMLALLDSLTIEPNSYDAVLVLDMKAKLFIQKNQLEKAIEPWERVVQLSDQYGYMPEKQVLDIVFFLAQLYAQEGTSSKVPAQQQQYFTKALAYFKRFIDQTPKPTPEAMMTYASILYYRAAADPNNVDQSLLQQAREIVERGLMTAIKPKEGFYQLLLTLQQQQNDLAGSAEILELLLKQAPNKKDYWQLLMATYLQLSERHREHPETSRDYLVRAIVTCERAQALGHLSTPKDNMNLVSLYLMANQFSKGTELLYNGMKKGTIESEPNNWRVLGRYYQEANMNTQAIAVLEEAAKLFPKNGEIEVQIAQLHIQMERPKDALRHAQTAIQKGNFETTKPFSVHYLIAYTAYDVGELDMAQKAVAAAEKFSADAEKDAQFPKLKAVIADAITERENKAKEKQEKAAGTGKKTASLD